MRRRAGSGEIDVSPLSAGLATQAIARESDRIAALDADIRERAFFNRRLKGEQFMDRARRKSRTGGPSRRGSRG